MTSLRFATAARAAAKSKYAFAALAALLGAAEAGPALAEDVKVAVISGISGPIAALAPPIIDASRLAIAQVNDQGGILGGRKLMAVVGDSSCSPQGGTDAATKAVNVEGVVAIVGPGCSGATLAAANSVAIPAGVVLVSPTATSPEVTRLEDKDLVFRTAPSDSYQGQALARSLLARGVKKVAVAYINNDYGKGFAEAFRAEYENKGGIVAGYAAHEEGKASYRAELASLAESKADTLVLLDYGDGTGLTILRQALENGFFEKFVGGDGMKSESLIEALGAENLEGFMASAPMGAESEALRRFEEAFRAADGDPSAVFTSSAYDAAFLVALAIEKAGSTERGKISKALREVATAPGEVILPGEWEKARKLIAEGRDINYQGAAGEHEFDGNGDVPGAYGLFGVEGKSLKMVSAIN
ncbi:ABC transporter substrate-binding protein [Pelagibius marinus]|uniref:ABC transporter substrate-binding protein n=1 Tax=Pelagibius marinus TaxID=2762760 RepID=UPI0018733DEB|nr:ABC transporter substrate-binding protein [Pelagibius marinus]